MSLLTAPAIGFYLIKEGLYYFFKFFLLVN